MKELTIEQKAQKYDEAIKRAKALYDNNQPISGNNVIINNNFPELKRERENDMMRSMAIKAVHAPEAQSCIKSWGINPDDVIAWLEKQGELVNSLSKGLDNAHERIDGLIQKNNELYLRLEKQGEQKPSMEGVFVNVDEVREDFMQEVYRILNADLTNDRANQIIDAFDHLSTITIQKSVNKVKPKFKVGDWITDGNITIQIEAIENNCYLYCGDCALYSTKTADKVYHIWTIQDAKDGDVLACENGWTCIFKKLVNDETFSSYCFMDNTKWFCETGSECHTLKEGFVKAYHGNIYPAAKEQSDLLFTKMKEAGYEWDAEKRELRKIEQKFKIGDIIIKKDCHNSATTHKVINIEENNYILQNINDKYGSFDKNIIETDKNYELIKYSSSDEVEPKFKVGDWIICCDYKPIQIISIRTNAYEMSNGDIRPFWMIDNNDNIRPWTIKDAKDGDVLVNGNEIVIFKENNFNRKNLNGCMFVHCCLNNKNGYWRIIGGINPTDYKPASKEQRDTLIKAMVDAGYTFDFEKKELKKIEQKPVKNIVKTWKDMRLEVYQQASGNRHEPNYSDNTTKMFSLNDIDEIIEKMSEQEREEDEINLNEALSYIKDDTLKEFIKSHISWKQWKPLGKHLEALNMAINDEPLDISVRDDLNDLFEQLKQL